MGTYTLQATKSAILRYNNQTANDHTSTTFQATNINDALFLGFFALSAEQQKEEITSIELHIRTKRISSDSVIFYATGILSEWNENDVTYSAKENPSSMLNKISIGGVYEDGETWVICKFESDSYWNSIKAYGLSYLARIGVQIYGETEDFTKIIFDTAKGSYKPLLKVYTTGVSPKIKYISSLSPGAYSESNAPFVDRTQDVTFTWKVERTGVCASGNNLVQNFLWKSDGAENWNEINNIGSAPTSISENYTFTVAANTFSSGVIRYKITAQIDNGEIYSTSPLIFVTGESKPSAKCNYPKDTLLSIVDTTFAWDYIITSGGNQYAFELQKSIDGTEWTTLVAKTVSTETNTVVPAASLTGGDMYWRVRVYNNDDVASEWSDPAKVLVVAAPAAPGIVITSTAPRFAIRWSSADQQGYEIAVDGVTVLSRYGTVSTYTYDDWLTDGSHTVAVRVQNKYSLWSEWSTAALPILNTPGATIILGAKAAPMPQIRITSNGYDYYVVYRRGKRIAKVKPSILTTFTDNFANGENTYIVRGGYDENGNYGESAEITVAARYKTLTLYDTVSGKRLRLGNAKRQTRETNLAISQNATLTHYSGAQLPTAETGQQRDRRYQFECAFSTRDERKNAEALEAMLGHIVCVCDQYGTALVGIASSARLVVSQFLYSYTISVDEVDFDEVTANAT